MSGTRVLVVDDEPSIRSFVCASLRSEGYQVVEAVDGQEALQLMEQTLVGLVILDIVMPKLDGFEVCRQIREWSQVPIIMLSARASERDKVRCLRLGADDFMVKPVGIDEMLARVAAVLRRTQALGPPSLERAQDADKPLNGNLTRQVTEAAGPADSPTEAGMIEEGARALQEGLYEGTVRLEVKSPDHDIRPMVHFVQELRGNSRYRLLRLMSHSMTSADILLGLREPLRLREVLTDMRCVSGVRPSHLAPEVSVSQGTDDEERSVPVLGVQLAAQPSQR